MDNIEIIHQAWPDWTVVNRLGSGSFGSVYLVERRDITGVEQDAVKVMSIPREASDLVALRAEGFSADKANDFLRRQVRELVEEIRLMRSLKGYTNIVTIEDHRIIEQPEVPQWHILIRMEYLTPLNEVLAERTFNEAEVLKLGMDLCSALEVCRKHNVVHRDIKPENILMNAGGDFKLGDFGVARTVERLTTGFTRTGTYSYMAPEVYRGSMTLLNIDDAARVDVYSLGMVLYTLMNGNRLVFLPTDRLPTPEIKEQAIVRRMGGEQLPPPKDASPGLTRIILKACAYDPKDRYASAEQMRWDLMRVAAGEGQNAEESDEEEKGQGEAVSVTDASDPRSPVPAAPQEPADTPETGEGPVSEDFDSEEIGSTNGPEDLNRHGDTENRKGRLMRGLIAATAVFCLLAAGLFGMQRYVLSRMKGSQDKTVASVTSTEGKNAVDTVTAENTSAPVPSGTVRAQLDEQDAYANEAVADEAAAKATGLAGIPEISIESLTFENSDNSDTCVVVGRVNWRADGDVEYYAVYFEDSDGADHEIETTTNTGIDIQKTVRRGMCSLHVGAVPINGTENDAVWGSISFLTPNTPTMTNSAIPTPAPVHIPYHFAEAAIEEAVRESLGKGEGATIYMDELSLVTEIRLNDKNLSDISDLEFCTGLTTLDLNYNNICDVTALENMTELTTLELSFNDISDMTPLGNLTALTRLRMGNNHLIDISPLGTLTNLTDLDLSSNRIRDVSVLGNLKELENLDLGINQISDITAIGKLTGLKSLSLMGNLIMDITPLRSLLVLTELHLSNNDISDASPLRHLSNLRWLDLSDNRINDISSLSKLINITKLDLSYNKIEDVNILAEMKNMDELNLSHNRIKEIASLNNLKRLTSLYLSYNQISDISVLRNMKSLTGLSLNGNQISDVSVLEKLTNLTNLYLSDNMISDISALAELHQLWSLSLNANQISDVSALAELHRLDNLDLSNNQISDVTPLAGLKKLTWLHLSNNQIHDVTALEDLNKLETLTIDDNPIVYNNSESPKPSASTSTAAPAVTSTPSPSPTLSLTTEPDTDPAQMP